MNWNSEESSKLYGVENWGKPFFKINEKGNFSVSPDENKPEAKIDLLDLVEQLKNRGARLPVLVRFPDILKSRINHLFNCFKNAIDESGYQGSYKGVYPVKVNQERHLIEDLVKYGSETGLGLECGSKPELLIALSKMKNPENLIICNGFKDTDYIETAILSKRLNRNTVIVVDRFSELKVIIKAAKKLDVKPAIGFRAKLSTQGAGRWAESSGNKSKFGLSPAEMVQAVKILEKESMLECLELLHFHIGSQVPSISSIKGSLKEASRFFTELYSLGVKPKYIDVGGGLGVDYDGSGSSDSSMNYTDQEYANDVIYTVKSICDEKGIPHPGIVTESGRAIVAHSSMLIFDVLGCNNSQEKKSIAKINAQDHQVLRDLNDIKMSLNEKNLNEAFNDLTQIQRDVLQLFTYGVLSLTQRAQAEELGRNIAIDIKKLLEEQPEVDEEFLYELDQTLCDIYFCNFSLFQSLPDSWAMEQVFPVVPIHRHLERPSRRAVLVDLTCDSDGIIDSFIDPTTDQPQQHLEVHQLNKDEPYYMAVFLTGAYQEILGDMHNLFGDTDAVHVVLNKSGYKVDSFVKGDSITDVLKYVSYEPGFLLEQLREDCEESIEEGQLTARQARILTSHFEDILSGYTYLS